MNIKIITALFLSFVLFACSSTLPVDKLPKLTNEFNCKINQPNLLKSAVLLPFEDRQVISYEMLVDKQLFQHLRDVQITVLNESNEPRYFQYTAKQLSDSTQRNLNKVAIINGDKIEQSQSTKYTTQSLSFFRLSIEDIGFIPKSIQHTFNFSNLCTALEHST